MFESIVTKYIRRYFESQQKCSILFSYILPSFGRIDRINICENLRGKRWSSLRSSHKCTDIWSCGSRREDVHYPARDCVSRVYCLTYVSGLVVWRGAMLRRVVRVRVLRVRRVRGVRGVRGVRRVRRVVRRGEVHGGEVGQRAARHGQLAQRAAQPAAAAALAAAVHTADIPIRAEHTPTIILCLLVNTHILV